MSCVIILLLVSNNKVRKAETAITLPGCASYLIGRGLCGRPADPYLPTFEGPPKASNLISPLVSARNKTLGYVAFPRYFGPTCRKVVR